MLRPAITRIVKATTGSPIFISTFQIPVTRIDSVTLGAAKPHDIVIV